MVERPSRTLGFDAMNRVSLLVGGPSCSGRLISRRERQAFVCAVMATQGERAAS